MSVNRCLGKIPLGGLTTPQLMGALLRLRPFDRAHGPQLSAQYDGKGCSAFSAIWQSLLCLDFRCAPR